MVVVLEEYRTVDKTEWGAGPWQAEPDKVGWTDEATGLDCLIIRNDQFGNLNGYVGVPRDHPYFGKGMEEMYEVETHGGVTFAGPSQEGPQDQFIMPSPGRMSVLWWIGFDTGHAWDFLPGMVVYEKIIGPMGSLRGTHQSYKDLLYVTTAVTYLASQLADIAHLAKAVDQIEQQP